MSGLSHKQSGAEPASATTAYFQRAACFATSSAGNYKLVLDDPAASLLYKFGSLSRIPVAQQKNFDISGSRWRLAVQSATPKHNKVLYHLFDYDNMIHLVRRVFINFSKKQTQTSELLSILCVFIIPRATYNVIRRQSGPSSGNSSRALSPYKLQQQLEALRQKQLHTLLYARDGKNLQSVQTQLHSAYDVLRNVSINIVTSCQTRFN